MQQSRPVSAPCSCRGSYQISCFLHAVRAGLAACSQQVLMALLLPWLQEQVCRGLGLLHAHGKAMVRALRGKADWDAVDLEDPLSARGHVSGNMEDEGTFYETTVGGKALQPELANVDEVLANIDNRDLPYGAIGSFVSILAVRRTSRCAPTVAS